MSQNNVTVPLLFSNYKSPPRDIYHILEANFALGSNNIYLMILATFLGIIISFVIQKTYSTNWYIYSVNF